MDPLTRLLMQGAAGAAGGDVLGIEDVFSTWLYAGNNTTQTITNGIALADEVEIAPGTAIGGGYFAGFISHTADSVATHALIVAPAATGASGTGYPVTTDLQWRTSANTVGATSSFDGAANTALMTDSTAADFCTGLSIGGYSDWYLPARYELDIAYYNLKPTVDGNSTSWGINAYSVLKRTVNYTAGDPAQTSIAAFQTGGAEAFVVGPYFHWTSTEQSSTRGWAQRFIDGVLTDTLMTGTQPVRAFRKIPINDPLLDSYRRTGEGGLVWIKSRNNTFTHDLADTARGGLNRLSTNSNAAQGVGFSDIAGFTSSGFNLTVTTGSGNSLGTNYASWTFRKAEKFFDVVTYTGTGVARTVPHNLGSVPGCIIVKNIDTPTNWAVYHVGVDVAAPENYKLELNGTAARQAGSGTWDNTAPTASEFTVGTNNSASGDNYVAYLFAHDAGGFGDSGNESVVKCGSYTGNGSSTSPPTVDLGWEPQWILIKESSGIRNWQIVDNMRGLSVDGNTDTKTLNPNLADAEGAFTGGVWITSTGFRPAVAAIGNVSSATYIYIAIRRGPMKTPTDATEVFSAITVSTNDSTGGTTNFPVDLLWELPRADGFSRYAFTRLLSAANYLRLNSVDTENTGGSLSLASNTSFTGPNLGITSDIVYDAFRRAPGFFDVVAYTGTGAQQTISHNLGVTPELFILKARSSDAYSQWNVWAPSAIGISTAGSLYTTAAWAANGNLSAITASSWTTGTNTGGANTSGGTHIAYLFATCPGVSKVGSYTGTGTTLNIDCGFAAGARFVLIKRTNATGDWYVWDTARGIVSGNDPYLLINSTAAEVTSTDYIDPLASGFQITSTAPAAINASGGSFIYLSIA